MDIGRRTQAMVRSARHGAAVGVAITRLEAGSVAVLLLADDPFLRALTSPLDRLASAEVDLGVLDHVIDAAMAATAATRATDTTIRRWHDSGARARPTAARTRPDHDSVRSRLAERLRGNHVADRVADAGRETGRRPIRARPGSSHEDSGAPRTSGRASGPSTQAPWIGHVSAVGASIDGRAVSVADLTRPLRPRRWTSRTPASVGGAGSAPIADGRESAAGLADPGGFGRDADQERRSQGPHARIQPRAESAFGPAPHDHIREPNMIVPTASSPASAGGLADLVDRWGAIAQTISDPRPTSPVGLFSDRADVEKDGDPWGRGADPAFADPAMTEQLAETLDELLRREAEQHGLEGNWR